MASRTSALWCRARWVLARADVVGVGGVVAGVAVNFCECVRARRCDCVCTRRLQICGALSLSLSLYPFLCESRSRSLLCVLRPGWLCGVAIRHSHTHTHLCTHVQWTPLPSPPLRRLTDSSPNSIHTHMHNHRPAPAAQHTLKPHRCRTMQSVLATYQ